MPLKSKPSPPHTADETGTRWSMQDVLDGKSVQVSVTVDALEGLAPGGGSFATHGGRLMGIASNKYDRRELEADGSVRITRADVRR